MAEPYVHSGPTATCPCCGRVVSVRSDGKLRAHKVAAAPRQRKGIKYRPPQCENSWGHTTRRAS